MVMIEALACGTPVVGYRYATLPEIVHDGVTGYLCDDLDDLAAKLSEAGRLDRTAARAAVEDRFTTDRMVAQHLAVFERVLSSRQVDSAAAHLTRGNGAHADGQRAVPRPTQ
jgi:glycosyltransferase involved in cell wall biosynthesis